MNNKMVTILKKLIRSKKLRAFLLEEYQNFQFFKSDLRDLPWKLRYFFEPVQNNKIVFLCYGGKNYSCNPKYIAEEILAQGLDYDLVWLLRDESQVLPEKIRKAPYFGKQALYELATAKIIISNTKMDMRVFKKKGQYAIQVWHGSYSSKRLEKDAQDKLPKRYIKESKHNSRQTDLFVSGSADQSQQYRDAFWCNCEILECGFPRNDVLFHWDHTVLQKVRAAFGVPEDAKLVLYAPTFRDDGSTDAYDIDGHAVVKALEKNGDDWYFLVRMHPNATAVQSIFTYDNKVLNASNYPDMQELLLASDILITDYSSSVYEFSVLGKPSYIYASDVEAYDAMRGLRPDFYRLPYRVNRTNAELLEELEVFTIESGRENAAKFMEYFGGVDKGDASKQVVNRIRKIIENEEGMT